MNVNVEKFTNIEKLNISWKCEEFNTSKNKNQKKKGDLRILHDAITCNKLQIMFTLLVSYCFLDCFTLQCEQMRLTNMLVISTDVYSVLYSYDSFLFLTNFVFKTADRNTEKYNFMKHYYYFIVWKKNYLRYSNTEQYHIST